MSRFLSAKYNDLSPYTPGEQPKGVKLIKLNTNESPFAPSPGAQRAAREAAEGLRLYPDPEASRFTKVLADYLNQNPENNLNTENLIVGNGSDELLAFAFQAFHDEGRGIAFADSTYGFYRVYAALYGIPAKIIPLKEKFRLCFGDYLGIEENIIIANPNAPSGRFLSVRSLESLIKEKPERLVIIDEAYIDFGGESCLPLIGKYDNLLVIRTFSKSRSLAGARLGFAAGAKPLIEDMKKIKYSFNPYNVNSLTLEAGIGSLLDEEYFQNNRQAVINTRERIRAALTEIGVETTESLANFLFVKSPCGNGSQYAQMLRERGILVRHFAGQPTDDWVRVTIGSDEEMDAYFAATVDIINRR